MALDLCCVWLAQCVALPIISYATLTLAYLLLNIYFVVIMATGFEYDSIACIADCMCLLMAFGLFLGDLTQNSLSGDIWSSHATFSDDNCTWAVLWYAWTHSLVPGWYTSEQFKGIGVILQLSLAMSLYAGGAIPTINWILSGSNSPTSVVIYEVC